MIIIAVDTETTGVAGADRIVQVGAAFVEFVDGVAHEPHTFSKLTNPRRKINPRAMAVHGITDEMVADADEVIDVLDELVGWMETHVKGRPYALVAHNASFDKRFLLNAQPLGPWDELQCTLKLSRQQFSGLSNHKLGTVAQHCGLDSENLHDAAADALKCALIACQLVSHGAIA